MSRTLVNLTWLDVARVIKKTEGLTTENREDIMDGLMEASDARPLLDTAYRTKVAWANDVIERFVDGIEKGQYYLEDFPPSLIQGLRTQLERADAYERNKQLLS